MTCIVGLVHDGGVTLGADSMISNAYVQLTLAGTLPKIFRKEWFIFGCSGSSRMAQLVRFAFDPPYHDESTDTSLYMVTAFVDKLRVCLKEGGNAMEDKKQETTDGNMLVAYRGRLFCIHASYQVDELATGYYAIGSGQEVALGALHMSTHLGSLVTAEQRVRWALEAATSYSPGVGGPFVIETLAHDTAEKDEAA